MNERKNADTLLKTIMLITVLFYNGKAPSISINISLLLGSLIIIKKEFKEFKSFKDIGISTNNMIKNIVYGLILCSLYYYFKLGIEFIFGYNLTFKLISNLNI